MIFLSNRVHPDGKGDVTPLRARVATVAAAALTTVARRLEGAASTGRDFGPSGRRRRRRLERRCSAASTCCAPTGSRALRGKRVGLVTNHTGRARDGATTIDLLVQSEGRQAGRAVQPRARHPRRARRKRPVGQDEKTGLPIYSLYGETRRPTAAMLEGSTPSSIDIQDIGARFYTYMTTMAYVLEEAAKRQLPVIVLDRPNPIDGVEVEGPMLDKAQFGFTGYIGDAHPARDDDGRAGAAVQRAKTRSARI